MIWQPALQDDGASQKSLADTLLEQIPAMCGNPALVTSNVLTEAAVGVAAYLDEHEKTPRDLTPRRSCALVSQALEATGEAVLARRLRIFGSSVVYPASWVVTGHQTVWVLDVARLLTKQDPPMEIALFGRLQSALTTFADVWDRTSGQGVLGLKGLSAAARFVLGREAWLPCVQDLTSELHHLGVRQLDALHHRRQWAHTPAVMSLDL
jgi:hypothetical protein